MNLDPYWDVPSEREWTDEEREEFYAIQDSEDYIAALEAELDTCYCERIDVDVDDASNCPLHNKGVAAPLKARIETEENMLRALRAR
jgi:hypothetical protein